VIDPQYVLSEIARRAAATHDPLLVFWLEQTERRAECAKALRQGRGELAIVPIVIRDDSFRHPNSLQSDLVTMLEQHRQEVEEAETSRPPLVVVLISRTPLGLPQTSSPVKVPDWFPFAGGTVRDLSIDAINHKVCAPLTCREASIDEIRGLLHCFEESLVARLISVSKREPCRFERLLGKLSGGSVAAEGEGFQSLRRNVAWLESIANPTDYRVSSRNIDESILARLVCSIDRNGRKVTSGIAVSLCEAIAAPDSRMQKSPPALAAILLPRTPQASVSTSWAEELLGTLCFAVRFTTVAAHADSLPGYPVLLLAAVAENLKECLRCAIDVLDEVNELRSI
jgi:hypothetical protein